MKIIATIFLLLCIISCSKKSISELFEKGFQQSNKKAIYTFSKVLKQDTKNVKAYWRRANCYLKNGQYDKSINDINHAIQIDSAFNCGYLFDTRGHSYALKGYLKEAIFDYTTALKICKLKSSEPSTPREIYFFQRGNLYLKLKDTTSAVADLDSAILLWDKFYSAISLNSKISIARKEYKKVVNNFDKIEFTQSQKEDTTYSEDFYNLGLAKLKLGQQSYCKDLQIAAELKYHKAKLLFSQTCNKP